MSDVRLSIAVATHPARMRRALDLVDELVADDLVIDPDPAGPPLAWRTMRLAWLRTPGWATHRLVVQDDALPVAGAAALALDRVREAPSSPVAFYAGRHHSQLAHSVLEAEQRGLTWARPALGGWMPTVATALPVFHALEMCVMAQRAGLDHVADDLVLGRYLVERRVQLLVAVPSLFDHDDDEPSLANRDRAYSRRAVRIAE